MELIQGESRAIVLVNLEHHVVESLAFHFQFVVVIWNVGENAEILQASLGRRPTFGRRVGHPDDCARNFNFFVH
ncbi:hypothetical protein D3C71_1850440 [compost metagenome]